MQRIMNKKEEKTYSKNKVNWAPFIYILRKEWEKPGVDSEEDEIIRERIWESIHKTYIRNIFGNLVTSSSCKLLA